MSKLLDELENKSHSKHPSGFDAHGELAKTYFYQAHHKKEEKRDGKWNPALPWMIAAALALVALALFLSKSSIDIKVRMLGEIPSLGGIARTAAPDKGEFLIRSGSPDKGIVKTAYFAGDALPASESTDEGLTFCNARGSGWANCTIELKEPVDLSKLDIKYTARGARGDEKMLLMITDGDNRSYRMEKDLSSVLTADWQQYAINFRPVGKSVDLSNIKTIKFEFGSLTAGNYPGSIIYIKDVYLAKARRFKWL
jgi:hypothetical protein